MANFQPNTIPSTNEFHNWQQAYSMGYSASGRALHTRSTIAPFGKRPPALWRDVKKAWDFPGAQQKWLGAGACDRNRMKLTLSQLMPVEIWTAR